MSELGHEAPYPLTVVAPIDHALYVGQLNHLHGSGTTEDSVRKFGLQTLGIPLFVNRAHQSERHGKIYVTDPTGVILPSGYEQRRRETFQALTTLPFVEWVIEEALQSPQPELGTYYIDDLDVPALQILPIDTARRK